MRCVVGLVAIVFIAGCGSKTAPKQGQVMTRDDFKKAVLHKSKDEVIAAVGKPDKVSDADEGPVWSYWEKTKDPDSKNLDRVVLVKFITNSPISNPILGKVYEVTVEP